MSDLYVMAALVIRGNGSLRLIPSWVRCKSESEALGLSLAELRRKYPGMRVEVEVMQIPHEEVKKAAK